MNEIKIYHSIAEADKRQWDSLTENNVFMCYEWLKTLENISIHPANPHYIMIFNEKKLLAASVCYLQRRIDEVPSIDNLLLGRLRKLRLFKKFSFLPAVICNPKRGYGTHFIFSRELKKDQVSELQNKLIDTIEKISAESKASVCFYNLIENESSLIDALIKRGYHKTKSSPLNYIDIDWLSFDEYRKNLSRKFPRMGRKISNEINKNRKSGVTIMQLLNINGSEQRLFELLGINHRKHNPGKFLLKPDYIRQLKDNFGDNAVIYAAFKEGEITGVSVELRKGKEVFISNIGVDHERAYNDLTYFNLSFYEPIKNAIERNVNRIYGGNSLYKTKVKRGYKIADTYLFYKPAGRSKDLIIRIWFAFHRMRMARKLSYIKELQAQQ
jgi:predicted N-acyltransferase